MSKFIDKMNLPQYKYFNDMLCQDEERKKLVADCITASELIEHGNKREYQEGLVLLIRSKTRLPDFIYVLEEDQKRCRAELSVKNIKTLVKRVEKYAGILLLLHFYQGYSITRRLYLEDEIEKNLPEGQLKRLYSYDDVKDKYYKEILSVPKLVLINGELHQNYLMHEFTEKELKMLDELISVDVHFLVVIQSENQKDVAYIVGKEHGDLLIRYLKRHESLKKEVSISSLDGRNDLKAMLLSLLDYLEEVKKAKDERRKNTRRAEGTSSDTSHYPRYVDKNSIKIYDMRGTAELDAFRFNKKRGRLGISRRHGYEMVPHTRKGHERRYKDGKIVYVRSTIIHKERFEGIQSAHRINEKEEKE